MSAGFMRRPEVLMPRILRVVLLAAPLAAVPAIAEPASPSIEGKWIGSSANAKGTSYEFNADDSARWTPPGGAPASIGYILDGTTTPWSLQLLGFPQGPLMTKVKICVVAVDGDRLRLHCATVLPTEEEMKKWPSAFDPKATQEFVRAGATTK